MRTHKYKIAILASHPIQYQVPFFRRLSGHSDMDVTVYYCSEFGVTRSGYDTGFGRHIQWDIPLLGGYKSCFLTSLPTIPSAGSTIRHIAPSIARELNRGRFDAVLVHGYAALPSWFAFIAGWLSGTPLLFRGESNLLEMRRLHVRLAKKVVLTALFKRISAFLSIGSPNTEFYKFYGITDDRIFLVPYSVDNEFFSRFRITDRGRISQIKRRLRVQPDSKVVLYVSKLTKRKRPMDLLRAFEMIKEKLEASLIFVGDGVERKVLEDYVRKNSVSGVHFVGFRNQTELGDFYSIGDVFVLPSENEPWGLVVNEAMNFGLPVITTDKVGAARDLVKVNRNGFVHLVGCVDDLSKLLLKVLTDHELQKAMGRFSLEIINTWSYREDVEGMLNALEMVTRRGR